MLETSLEFLRCVRCESKLQLDAFKFGKEVDEEILECGNCGLVFPIIEKIPIMWDDFPRYLSSRKILGGRLYRSSESQKMRSFLKSSLSKITSTHEDRTLLEERWSKIYQNSRKGSRFYSTVKRSLDSVNKSGFVVEYGCSIGIMTSYLADRHEMVFGVDRSFDALRYAKNSFKTNLDYIAADLLSPVFGNLQFDLILALNILELVEPLDLLKRVSKQNCSGYFIVSDPYDFDRGTKSVSISLNEIELRKNLQKLNFKISSETKKPSYVPWVLKLNSRATLNYKVDLIMCKRSTS